MKSKLFLSMISMLLLSSCGTVSEEGESNTDETPSSNIQYEEGKHVKLADNNNALYNIIYGEVSSESVEIINDFSNKLSTKCEATFNVYSSSNKEQLQEIVIGLNTNRFESDDVSEFIMPTGYYIMELEEKIVVCAKDENAIKKALDNLYENIKEYGPGSFGLAKDYISGGDGYMDVYVPKPYAINATYDGEYYCENGNYQIGYTNATSEVIDEYGTMLTKEGFVKSFENTINDNKFVTYTSDKALVNLSYYNASKRFHILYGNHEFMPFNYEVNSTNIVTPSITQIGRKGASQSSPGLSMIVQLIDGSYIIIDGGPNDSEDEANLLKYLKDNNPNEGKPAVKWMFTHAHHDHMNLALSFLRKYSEEVNLEMFMYNFPDFDTLPISKEPTNRVDTTKQLILDFEEIYQNYYKGVPRYNFHTGDKLLLPGCEIEILLTHEAFWPHDFEWINHTSSSLTMTINNHKIMVLGDTEKTECEYMEKLYGETLKSEIMQATHHGLNGASLIFYQLVDPDIVFWPIDDERYQNNAMCLGTQSGFEFNYWLRNQTIKKRAHYAATNTNKIELK